MYEIYAYPYGNPDAKLLLYRPNDPQALVLSPKLTREVSKGGSLVFTMTRDHAQYDMLQKLSTVVQVRRDGKEIWRGRVLKHEADFYNRRVVYCEGALSYFNDSSITPFNYKGTLRQFLQHLIDAHNDQVKSKMKCFQLGTVTAALGNLVVQFGDADQYGVGEDYGKVWDILDKLVLKVFGGYFYCSFDSSTGLNVLNYCDQAVEAKRQTAQKIEYGRNLLNLSETTDATDLYTRMRGKVYQCKVYNKALPTKLLEEMFPNIYSNESRIKGSITCYVNNLQYLVRIARCTYLEVTLDLGKHAWPEYAGKYPKAVGIKVTGLYGFDDVIWVGTGTDGHITKWIYNGGNMKPHEPITVTIANTGLCPGLEAKLIAFRCVNLTEDSKCVPATGIGVNWAGPLTIAAGGELKGEIVLTPAGANTMKDFKMEATGDSITASTSGTALIVRGISPGSATITVTHIGGAVYTCTINVT